MATIRAAVPHYDSDRYMADDLAWAQQAVLDGGITKLALPLIPASERA
jgi:histidine ammonia-lyase